MITILLASRAFAQDPATEPPPAEPEPPVVLPVDPVPEPVPEPIPAAPGMVGVPDVQPDPEPETPTPWVETHPSRDRFLRYGLFVEAGSLANDDPAYDLFSDGNGMGSFGVRLDLALAKHLAIVGSWHHFRQGSDIDVEVVETGADFESDRQSFRAAMRAHEGAVGLRVDGGIMDVLFPFVTAQALLLDTNLRLDDAPHVNDNPGQVQATALSEGWMATAGAELRVPPESRVQAAWTLEFGYGWLTRATFGDFGSMQPGGFVARSGVGLRF